MKIEKRNISATRKDGSRKEAIVCRFVVDDFDYLKNQIDQYIVDLIYGDSKRSFDAARNQMAMFVSSKTQKQKLGIVSELLMHLSAMELNATRYNLIKNLEDNSMKKGFDGVYVYDSELWFGESKSSSVVDTKHIINIDESIKCFGDKINGRNKNDPWVNALYHINVIKNEAKMSEPLKKQIIMLSEQFARGIFCDSRDFNVIPSSTLIVEDNQTFDEICNDCESRLLTYNYRKLVIFCIDNIIYQNTLDYLEMKNG